LRPKSLISSNKRLSPLTTITMENQQHKILKNTVFLT
jgi:hypothetical protein